MPSLWPREHGAYAQLLVPTITALIASPTLPGGLIAAGAWCAFLANEPLLVLLGHRGARARGSLGRSAARRLAITASAAALTGGIGLVLATPLTRVAAAFVAIPAAVMLVLAWRRAAHSLPGELVAAVTLPGAAVPIAVAAGASWHAALATWLAWSLGYGASVVAVHHVIARRRGPTPSDRLRLTILIAALLGALACVRALPALVASLPLAGVATVVAVWSPSPRHLRAIGVVLVIASVLSAGALLATSF